MKKQGYFDDLKKELRNVELRVAESVMKAMHEHYDFALLSGKTEAEACEELGDPKDVTRELAEQEALIIANEKSASKLQKMGSDGYKTVFPADKNTVEMAFTNMDMEVGTSPSQEIQFVGSSLEEVERCFRIEIGGNSLIIKDRYRFNIASYIRHERQQAKLLLPQDYSGSLIFGVINSNIIAQNVKCGFVSVKETAGSMEMRNITCDSFTLHCVGSVLKASKSSLGNCSLFSTGSTVTFTDVDCSKLDLKNTGSTVEIVGGASETLFRNR